MISAIIAYDLGDDDQVGAWLARERAKPEYAAAIEPETAESALCDAIRANDAHRLARVLGRCTADVLESTRGGDGAPLHLAASEG